MLRGLLVNRTQETIDRCIAGCNIFAIMMKNGITIEMYSLWKCKFDEEVSQYLPKITGIYDDRVVWVLHRVYPIEFYQTTNCRLFQNETVCRRQFQLRWKWQKVIQTRRKHCGKRRNCSLRAISPFPTVFSKGLFLRGVKRWHCVGMG